MHYILVEVEVVDFRSRDRPLPLRMPFDDAIDYGASYLAYLASGPTLHIQY